MPADPFKWKISASLEGQERLLKKLLEMADAESRREALLKIASIVRKDARRLVPVEEGELRREIKVIDNGGEDIQVGVPASSPAIDKAWATEYGTWNFDVGTPANPKTDWPAKQIRSKPTATMPWLRTAVIAGRPRFLRFLRRYFATGKRERGRLEHESD